MTKQVNPNIGHIVCPICQQHAAIRRNIGKKLYFDCMTCGRIYPNHSGGQRFILETGVIWPAGQAPADVPAWIREQWPYVKALRHRDFAGTDQDAANDPQPDTMPAPAIAPDALAALPPPPPRRQAANDDAPADAPRGFAFLNI